MKNNFQLPEKFLNRLNEMYGAGLVNHIKETFVERPTTFRVNTIKASRTEVLDWLRNTNFKIQTVAWYPDAFILQNRTKRELTETALYLQGKIYIQSLASMVPPLILDPQPGERVLDLTAAPGSKTSQIAALMRQEGELVANDNNKVRFFKLKHNMELLGVGGWNFTLRMEHGVKLCREYKNYFEKILLDAPCSAEARFIEGERETYGYWSERKIKEMAHKQRQLLFAAWESLKAGGTLVYSTCTLAPEENEMQIQKLIERYGRVGADNHSPLQIDEVVLSGLKYLPPLTAWREKAFSREIKKCLRIMPTKEMEGFFVAKIRKR